MKRLVPVLMIGCVVACLTVAFADRGLVVVPTAPDGTVASGNNWLLVIGIDNYRHWPRLRTAVSDAMAVRDVLVERYAFDPGHVIGIYDEAATEEAIIGALRRLARQVKEEDSLVIFYAGHGHVDPITQEGSWIPVDSATDNASAWISNHSIKNYLKADAIRARHILLVSDSCFSGDFFRGQRGDLPKATPELIKKAWQRASRQAISSGGLEPVSDAGFGNHSIFSYFFIKALKENPKPYLMPSDIFAEVRAGVAQNADQFPQMGTLSGAGGQEGGEFIFLLRQRARIEDLAAAEQDKVKELERLQAMEEQARLAGERERQEIEQKEKALADLDAKIAAMQQRLGTSAQAGADSLDAMVTMVRQKESEQRQITALKLQKTNEEARRRSEIDRLRKAQQEKTRAALEEDIRKYEEIAKSEFGRTLARTAWQNLVEKYAPGAKMAPGDTAALRYEVTGPDPTYANDLGMTFVWIQPGTFMMGSPPDEAERLPDEARHQVTLTRGFYMQTTEVTQGQWKAVMGDNPSHFKVCGDRCPVEQVSWSDAQTFIEKLNRQTGQTYRLPTEAEWEYACRAGGTSRYSWGDDAFCEKMMCENSVMLGKEDRCVSFYRNNRMTVDSPAPVASFDANEWGVYDMHGNVWEWCSDWYGEYPPTSVTDPTGPATGVYHVARGGSWLHLAYLGRSAFRFKHLGTAYSSMGLRLVYVQTTR